MFENGHAFSWKLLIWLTYSKGLNFTGQKPFETQSILPAKNSVYGKVIAVAPEIIWSAIGAVGYFHACLGIVIHEPGGIEYLHIFRGNSIALFSLHQSSRDDEVVQHEPLIFIVICSFTFLVLGSE